MTNRQTRALSTQTNGIVLVTLASSPMDIFIWLIVKRKC